jgi:hypothetical protein
LQGLSVVTFDTPLKCDRSQELQFKVELLAGNLSNCTGGEEEAHRAGARHDLTSLDLGLSRLNNLAPEGYALALHIRFASANLMFQTYDPRWIERYTERGYMLCDPLVSWGFSCEGAIRWSELANAGPPQHPWRGGAVRSQVRGRGLLRAGRVAVDRRLRPQLTVNSRTPR